MTRTLVAVLVVMGLGCSRGSNQWYEKANPETSLKVHYNPMTATWEADFYSNDGRAMTADSIEAVASKDAKNFKATNLKITERSVENRTADAAQTGAMGDAMSKIAKANWDGAAGVMHEATQGIAAIKAATPPPSTQPSNPVTAELKAFILKQVEDGIKQKLQPTVPQTMNIRKPDGNARGLYENDCVAYAAR